jgi:hypothetical protein
MKTLFLVLFLVGCAARPPFHKMDNGTGYIVKPGPFKEMVEVHIELPSNVDERFRDDYLLRAAGEECLERGFPYYDFGYKSSTTVSVICYPTVKKPSLSVGIDPKIALSKHPKLQVEEPENGMPGPFKPFDVIRKVGGAEISTIGELKEKIFLASRENAKTVTLQIERSGIPINLEALGGGDVKLIAGTGAMMGWLGLIGPLFLGSLAGGAAAVFLILAGKKTRRRGSSVRPFSEFWGLCRDTFSGVFA